MSEDEITRFQAAAAIAAKKKAGVWRGRPFEAQVRPCTPLQGRAGRARGGGTLTGIYDATQMKGVETEWSKSKTSGSKLAAWKIVKKHLASKVSKPYSPTGVHDFMHNKLLVTSRVVVTGSFNLSRNAASNAENVLAIHDPKLATAYTGYIASLVKMYS
jgi:phosphatidylserine/phosphatidylglycerophosphate/cardiolipin synthase-like enzyme